MNLQLSPLDQSKQQSLRDYLTKTEFDILIQVLASLAFEKTCESATALAESKPIPGGDQFPGYAEKAKVLAAEANSIRETVELLKKLRAQTAPYRTATATP